MDLRQVRILTADPSGSAGPAGAPNHKEGTRVIIDKIALILAIVGGLNWGSIGIFGFDLVAFLCGGSSSAVSRIVYTLVGLAALWCISLLFRNTEAAGENT